MKTHILASLIATTFAAASPAAAMDPIAPPKAAESADAKPLVQLAILLDTSNSMDGLIAQAKSQLWQIVNEFIAAKQDGKTPQVEVALYEYGNDGLSKEKGWVRQVSGLTTDLDKISEALFSLKTNGGSEFCGWTIRDAVRDLQWSKAPNTYKAIFIAGNEEFTQGPVKYSKACKDAIEAGVIVNTIHCGDEKAGLNGKWKDAALLADGKFLTIDTNAQIAQIDAPQDKRIAELNAKLNDTYVAYGRRGAEGKRRQVAQDGNVAATAAPASVAAARAKTKASGNYDNSTWDAVDAVKDGKLDVEKAPESDLPEELRKLAPAKRVEYIAEKQKERETVQSELKKLTGERDKYVAKHQAEQSGGQRLEEAVSKTVRSQAAKKSFVFEKEK